MTISSRDATRRLLAMEWVRQRPLTSEKKVKKTRGLTADEKTRQKHRVQCHEDEKNRNRN